MTTLTFLLQPPFVRTRRFASRASTTAFSAKVHGRILVVLARFHRSGFRRFCRMRRPRRLGGSPLHASQFLGSRGRRRPSRCLHGCRAFWLSISLRRFHFELIGLALRHPGHAHAHKYCHHRQNKSHFIPLIRNVPTKIYGLFPINRPTAMLTPRRQKTLEIGKT